MLQHLFLEQVLTHSRLPRFSSHPIHSILWLNGFNSRSNKIEHLRTNPFKTQINYHLTRYTQNYVQIIFDYVQDIWELTGIKLVTRFLTESGIISPPKGYQKIVFIYEICYVIYGTVQKLLLRLYFSNYILSNYDRQWYLGKSQFTKIYV